MSEDTTKYVKGQMLHGHRRGLDAGYRTELFTDGGIRVAAVDLCPETVPNGEVYLRGGTARRLAATWNACAGIPTEQLEAGVIGGIIEFVKRVIEADEDSGNEEAASDNLCLLAQSARAALAKLEWGKP